MKLMVELPDNIYKELTETAVIVTDIYPVTIERALTEAKPLPQCKDCKHFETDAFATIDGIQLIVGHEVCTKWGAGCKTKEDGYCFMFEPKE